MNKITFPLEYGMLSSAVGDLQDALLLFLDRGVILRDEPDARRELSAALQRERDEQVYKDATRKLVAIFQETRQMRPDSSGEVDEATAREINAVLGQLGVLDGQDDGWKEVVTALNEQEQTLSVIQQNTASLASINEKLDTLSAINSGTNHLTSIDEKIGTLGNAPVLSLNMRGEAVKDLHAQLERVGIVLPANEMAEGIFGVGTRDAVLQLQAKYDLAHTGIFDDGTRNVLAIAVGSVAHSSRVEGRIFLENGLPAASVRLRIVNKGFGEDMTVLGEVETDERGFYALPYTMNGTSLNIEVRTFDADGKEMRLSNPKVHADRNEILNLVAPSTVKSQANEFALMTGDLGKVVGPDMRRLAQAQESQDQPDVSLLHQSTDWDARLIATAATAASMSTVTGITDQALYGAFRAGLPTAPEALAQVSTEAFATALARARDAGVVALDDTRIHEAGAAFESFAFETRRTMIVPGTLSSVGDMLEKVHIEPVHKEAFEKLVLLHEDDDAALWTEAKAQGIPDVQIARLQLQGKLAYLTLNNAPLTEVLQSEIASQDNLAQLVDKDLYRKDEWVKRLEDMARDDQGGNGDKLARLIPAAYTQEDVNERLDAYADDMARQVRQSFPTHVLKRMVEKDDLKLGVQHSEMKVPVQTFLKNAINRGFQPGRTPVDQFLKQHGETVFEGIAEDKKDLAEAGVKLLTRAYQMTPSDEAMAMLLELGFTSAQQVTAIPKADFMDRYWRQFGSRKVTETVYDKSAQITSVTFNIYTLAKKMDSTPPTLAISGTPERHEQARDALKSLLKEYPTMASLFGSLDFCECEHCRSVLSPAAYLVDLLRFVDPPTQDWKQTLKDWEDRHNGKAYDGPDYNFLKPYDALVLRRPDLPHLPLTCENTNTALPYIDLVNEILEYYVAYNRLDADAAYDTGEATSAELIAEPHNIIPTAYNTLKGAHYPLTLPFDLWLETVRRFCAYYGTPWWQVLETFRQGEELFTPETNPATYGRAHIFAEYLGLSPDEYAIYTSPTLADWPRLYGYDSDTEADALAKLQSAKTLSRRLSVSYRELTELMKTAFVNPKLHTLVTLRKLGVEVSDIFHYKKHAGYTSFTVEEEAEFEKRLTQLTEKFKPNFDAKQWLNDAWNDHQFEKVLVLRDPDAGCSFDETLVTCADGTDVDALAFVKLNMFVRLWKRLGWTMEETDRALHVFFPDNIVISKATLGNALKTALIYLAHLQELTELLSVGKDSRMNLLTFWADLPEQGKNSMYARLFLTRNILKDDIIFDDPLGNYLSDPDVLLKDHLPALQAALNVTADEIAQIVQDGNESNERDVNRATLSLANVSMLYRYGLLARALQVSISELIILKALSGSNPFHALSLDALGNIEDDYALTHTLEFVRQAQQVKASAFTISDLDYLFRHRFDPMGNYREDGAARLAWVRTLAEELHTIASICAVPATMDSVSDDALREKMALVFAPDVVDTFISFWLNSVVYSAAITNVPVSKRINRAVYERDGISIAFDVDSVDPAFGWQRVTHTGVFTSENRATLIHKIPPPLPTDQDAFDAHGNFLELLDELVSRSSTQFKEFFDKHFDGLLKFDDFFGEDVNMPPAEKRLCLLKKIVPFLQAKLTRRTIVQAMATQTGAEPALVEALLTNSAFLALPDADTGEPRSLMAQFEGLGQHGLTAMLMPSGSNAQPINKTTEVIEVQAKDTCKQAHWRGFIEVPQSGAYRFYAKMGKKDAEVDLRLDSAVESVLAGKAAQDGDELSGYIELKSGMLYSLTLAATNLQEGAFTLRAKGEITAKSPLSQFVLLPQTAVDSAAQAYTMFVKALQLAQGLGLSERDIRHILTYSSDFSEVNWKLLPAQETEDTEENTKKAVALFKAFVRLVSYATLKRDLAGGSDDLIAIFERARQKNPDSTATLAQQIATLTRRKPDVVQATATRLQMNTPAHFADEARMERLWQALQIVEKFGVSVASLQTWLTPRPNEAVAMDVRNTIKSRYEPEAWQRIARAIFDPLRQRQRDALVAYIMHIKDDLDSVEKLFEYFLIDPATEPVVQTSRLRLAISSLQTFIQRCFLNLEKQVHPAVLNAQHWSWMKRYRVWEANRKIFLFPENWLEPEWRDDKTHLYQELESSLLQGDVTNQLAEDALYLYLKKLDQLAQLEIVTMYIEEKPFGPPTVHVVGRTYALPHQYFYRRYERQMWTPWEPVTAEIDGDHIVAVMWRERLHLFWLTFMEKVEQTAGGLRTSETGALGGLGLDKLVTAAAGAASGAVRRTLDIQLNWSEYFQGAWTMRESGGFGNPIDLYDPFDARKVFVTVSSEVDPETGADGAVRIHLNGLPVMGRRVNAVIRFPELYFRVVSKNSRPQLLPVYGGTNRPTWSYSPEKKSYNRYEGSGALSVKFVQQVVTTDGNRKADPSAPHPILSWGSNYTLLPGSNQMRWPNEEFAPLVSPMFYADDMYTFFVEPSLTETTMEKWQGYTIRRPSQKPKWEDYLVYAPPVSPLIPPRYLQEAFKLPENIPLPDPIDQLALHTIKPNLDALTRPDVAVQFGDAIVGRIGRLQDLADITHVVTDVDGSINLKLE